MASKGFSDSALNEYFEAMSFQDEEEKTWQEYTDFLVSRIEALASTFRNQRIPIDIRAFGSSVEKLRIISPENIGDIDVMVFSLADETRITESIMEYPIPGNPVYVRLRGKDHPILQQCLAENSDYVASSTLINFHPKVFGDSAGFFNLIPKVFQKMQDIPGYEVACAVQSKSGPSIQWDFSQTRESLHDHVTGMKSYSEFKSNDEMRGFYDWIAIALNPGKPFSEDHSAIIDETSKFLEKTVQGLSKNPSIENFSAITQELSTGPKIQEIRKKLQALETKAAEELGERDVNEDTTKDKNRGVLTEEVDLCANQVEAKGTTENEETARQQNPGMGELQAFVNQVKPEGIESTNNTEKERENDDDVQKHLNFMQGPATAVSEEAESEQQHPVARELQETVATENDARELQETGVTENAARELQETGATEKTASSGVPLGEGQETDMAKIVEENIKKFCIETFLQVGDSSKSQEERLKEYLQIAEDQTRQKGGFDMVPGFLAKGWPIVARDWISRDRLWPNQNVISSILDYGFHLVSKTPNESERPDLDFRLSFSHAELVLSKELNDVQRQCYRCFKSYQMTINRNRKQKIFATYFLKTILFWAIEETGMEFWNSENRGSCVMMLLRRLLKALETKFLSHYFIPEFNLLRDIAKEFPEEMEFLAQEVRNVCEDPMSYPNASPDEDQGANAVTALGPISDPLAEDAGSRRTTASSCGPMDTNLPAQKEISMKSQYSSEPLGNTNNNANSASAPFFPRFQDFKVLYRQVYREMLDLALTDEALDDKDPTIRSIVSNMRKVMEKMENNQEKGMETVLENGLEGKYSTYVFHNGPTPRDRVLSLLKGECEAFAYMVRQEDLVPGNEHIIANRMITSARDGSSDPFDLSVMFPGTSNVVANIFEVIGAQFESVKQSKVIDDDIPLD